MKKYIVQAIKTKITKGRIRFIGYYLQDAGNLQPGILPGNETAAKLIAWLYFSQNVGEIKVIRIGTQRQTNIWANRFFFGNHCDKDAVFFQVIFQFNPR